MEDHGCGIDARKTERISRANGRDEHEINGNVRRNMELEAGERGLSMGQVDRRGKPWEEGDEWREGRDEKENAECGAHEDGIGCIRMCAHTCSGCRLCCRRRRCRSSLPTQLLDALRQPSRHDLSAFSTTTPFSVLHALCLLSPAFVRRSRRRRRWCFSPSSFLHSPEAAPRARPHSRIHARVHTCHDLHTRFFLAREYGKREKEREREGERLISSLLFEIFSVPG